jgi:hypothetical protein
MRQCGSVHASFTRSPVPSTSPRTLGGPLSPSSPARPQSFLVDSFVDGLARLSLSAWLDIGETLIAQRATSGSRATALAILDATIAAHQLQMDAWHVRDAVETAAHVAWASVSRRTREHRRAFFTARDGAADAALALLAQPHLAAVDFELIHSPFAGTAGPAVVGNRADSFRT